MAAAAGVIAIRYHENITEEQRKNELRLLNRHLRDVSNPFELPNKRFMKLFRLNKEASRYLINSLNIHLENPRRRTAIPNYLKVLCALHFFAHGSYQIDAGADYNLALSQPSVSRIINTIIDVLTQQLLNTWIKFPTEEEQISQLQNQFREKYNFPHTIGAIDGTHIAIIAPPLEHPIFPAGPYYNRKGYYSINVQVITDANLNILSMNARFPGSVHDAAIWMMSSINRHLQNQYLNNDTNYHLIGDEGYPLLPWLMIKYPGDLDVNTPEGRFNEHLIRARLTIERLNGVLKGRFRCLLKHRTLNYTPARAAKIIYACGILHNIAQHFRMPVPDNANIEDENLNDNYVRAEDNQNIFLVQGTQKRDRVTQLYFT